MEEVKPGLQLVCDFVNTLDLESGADALGDPRALERWLAAHGIRGAPPGDRDAATARAVREALRELMRANNGCESDPVAAAATLEAAAQAEGVTVAIGAGAAWPVAPAGGLGAVLATAAGAMADGSWRRLKACRADGCRWAFVDSARNRSRQWCSMQVCGNREKARAFRRRRAGGHA
jgi:predicted RNA-binding Zn ribbon-like protein